MIANPCTCDRPIVVADGCVKCGRFHVYVPPPDPPPDTRPTCAYCKQRFDRRPGLGRPAVYCSKECGNQARDRRRAHPAVTQLVRDSRQLAAAGVVTGEESDMVMADLDSRVGDRLLAAPFGEWLDALT